MPETKVHPVKQLTASEIIQKQQQVGRAMLKVFNARAKELSTGQKVHIVTSKNA